MLVHQGCRRVWAMDEGRFGLKIWFRRRWCPPNVRPPWVVDDQYEWRWLYLALEPSTGASFALLLPRTDAVCLQIFVDAFAAAQPSERIGLVLDNSGAHRSRSMVWGDGIQPVPLPPYSPELNPVERVFQEFRARLANRIFTDLDELDEAITEVLREYWTDPARLRQLTGYDWWLNGVDATQPSAL